jgi:hypothetical protein
MDMPYDCADRGKREAARDWGLVLTQRYCAVQRGPSPEAKRTCPDGPGMTPNDPGVFTMPTFLVSWGMIKSEQSEKGVFDMRRAVLVCAVLAVLSPGCAEATERIWRVGVLALADDSVVRSIILPYLATRGFVEGRNLVVDVRVGTEEQMPEFAQALAGDKADVIIAASDWAVHAARAATNTIPIVAAPIGTDPVRAGVAES